MQKPALGIKRSQSDNLFLQSKIISPSPFRQPSKLSFHVAREIFDFTSSADAFESHTINGHLTTAIKSRFYSLPADIDSQSNEWGSESSQSNSIQSDCESPLKLSYRGQLIPDGLDNHSEMAPRASNPIVNDANFMRCNQEVMNLDSDVTIMARP